VTTLLAVPNVSEGRDGPVLDGLRRAFGPPGGARVLDVHADPDHGRCVFTLSGAPGRLADALHAGARRAVEEVRLGRGGSHPHVGVLDVVPLVFLDQDARGAACAEALVAADLIGELGVPVFLYGALAGGRTRAELRRGGVEGLGARMAGGLRPDFGPGAPHRTAGATLVAARPPLVAFNVELAPPAGIQDAQRIAALIREGGERGLPGLRAIGLTLPARGGVAQVSMNVEDHRALPLADVVGAIGRHARVVEAELVGLAPAAAFAGFPEDVPVRNRRTLEEALAA